MAKAKTTSKKITATVHEAKRMAIPTAEEASYAERMALLPKDLKYPRNSDLDPQLVWRGKDAQDERGALEVNAFPIYIQEKIHPRVLVEDLKRETEKRKEAAEMQLELFADFNGVPKGVDKTDFYRYEKNWTNRMILGDSLQVMASLAEKEGLRGKVQCVYMDPPYGIKFGSNFQWSASSPVQKDGKDITREPEMVCAYRDTWRDGIHSYLGYLRDRLTLARDLLTESGSIFVQIGDENVHRVRAILDEVFGAENAEPMITYASTIGLGGDGLSKATNYVLWYCKDRKLRKYRPLLKVKEFEGKSSSVYSKIELESGKRIAISAFEKESQQKFEYSKKNDIAPNSRIFKYSDVTSQGAASENQDFKINGRVYSPGNKRHWTTSFPVGMLRLARANRLGTSEFGSLAYIRYFEDFPGLPLNNIWTDTTTGGFNSPKIYVVQTTEAIIQRCILMSTDPGDLVLDPTCGSGTTAFVAEQWGRRWITIDTSRVALSLARARLMGARYPYYLLADSKDGQMAEAKLTGKLPSESPVGNDIRHGFVYQRIPHLTLKSIAYNQEIDTIWERFAPKMDALRNKLDIAEEWLMPRIGEKGSEKLDKATLKEWWDLRVKRQKEIDASNARHAETEYLYDKPVEDKSCVRVAGPFTMESLNPFRTLALDADGTLLDPLVLMATQDKKAAHEGLFSGKSSDYMTMILGELKKAGVQQVEKKERIEFESVTPMPGKYIGAEGKYTRDERQVRAAIFIGPEFATVTRSDLVEAAREAADCGYDELIACAFNFDASSTELSQLGRIPILKARMNADLHMAEDLKSTGKGNLFVVFGEPDVKVTREGDMLTVKLNGVDVYNPTKGNIQSDDTNGVACWFVDTEYNSESFFVRQTYFLGQKSPYESLKNTLKAQIDQEAWDSINSEVSRPFPIPSTGRFAIKVINCLGDEVLKVFDKSSWEG